MFSWLFSIGLPCFPIKIFIHIFISQLPNIALNIAIRLLYHILNVKSVLIVAHHFILLVISWSPHILILWYNFWGFIIFSLYWLLCLSHFLYYLTGYFQKSYDNFTKRSKSIFWIMVFCFSSKNQSQLKSYFILLLLYILIAYHLRYQII